MITVDLETVGTLTGIAVGVLTVIMAVRQIVLNSHRQLATGLASLTETVSAMQVKLAEHQEAIAAIGATQTECLAATAKARDECLAATEKAKDECLAATERHRAETRDDTRQLRGEIAEVRGTVTRLGERFLKELSPPRTATG